MKPKFYLIPLAIIAVSILAAVCIRSSYTDKGAEIYTSCQYDAEGDLDQLREESKISSPDGIIKQADLIVRAVYGGKRQITSTAFYSQAVIQQVYKGDKSLAGKNICVLEPAMVFVQKNYINGGGHFLVPLQPGNTYLLLLKHKQFAPERKLSEEQKIQYYPVTQGAFGCYRLSGTRQTAPLPSGGAYTISSLKDRDIFTSDAKVFQAYRECRKKIFSFLQLRQK